MDQIRPSVHKHSHTHIYNLQKFEEGKKGLQCRLLPNTHRHTHIPSLSSSPPHQTPLETHTHQRHASDIYTRHTHNITHTHTHSPAHTHSHTLSHSHTHTHTHTHTHA